MDLRVLGRVNYFPYINSMYFKVTESNSDSFD